MADWMNALGEEENKCPQIDRLVILGPLVETKLNGCDVQSVVRTLTLSRQEKQSSAKSLTTVDKLIASLAEKPLVNTVDVSPGVGDPCSSMWPLPPIHRVCLPRCGMSKKKVNLVTNPYEFELNGLRVMTMSGENVTELLRTSTEWSSADVLENLVKWQHVAPNCPDTLDSFPMADRLVTSSKFIFTYHFLPEILSSSKPPLTSSSAEISLEPSSVASRSTAPMPRVLSCASRSSQKPVSRAS